MKSRFLAANSNNSAAISEDGKIYVWGARRFGLVADANNIGKGYDYQSTPIKIDISLKK
jgi:alpha-tubulin suppressor-like RCC1 family protein